MILLKFQVYILILKKIDISLLKIKNNGILKSYSRIIDKNRRNQNQKINKINKHIISNFQIIRFQKISYLYIKQNINKEEIIYKN